ncbi:MAG: hypothetical protein U9N02_07615 [Campylobacterota bacterium]|nr:hypothetical protein [Campylobacterota bacterium]
MSSKLTLISFATSLFLLMGLFFLANPSYKISIEAKYHYEMREYKEAYALAQEAFSLDLYNRMASTIMAQSKISLRYVSYIDLANKYMKSINDIATHETISDADKAKIRTICEIMIGSYTKLAPSVITDKDLVDKVASYHEKFENLREKVNN